MKNSKREMFESFDDSLHYYAPRISPFLTSDVFDEISNNPSKISEVMNKETYDKVTKDAMYENEIYFGMHKIIIYLEKKEGVYYPTKKYLATYILEQIFDNNNIISQEINKF